MQPYKILVIDDSQFILDSFRLYLEKLDGVELNCLKDGVGAPEVIKDYQPDLIFLDYILENTDGIRVLKDIKKDKASENIPVFMISSKENSYDQQLALMHGAKMFLQKPLKGSTIREIITTYREKSVAA